MPCPVKTVAVLVLAFIGIVFGCNIDISSWKIKMFGDGKMG